MNIFTGEFEPNSSVSATGRVPSTPPSLSSGGSRRNSTLPSLFGTTSPSISKEFQSNPVSRKLSVQLSKGSYDRIGVRPDAKRSESQVNPSSLNPSSLNPSSLNPSSLYPALNDSFLQGQEMREFVAQDEESGSEKVKLKLMSMWNNMKYGRC